MTEMIGTQMHQWYVIHVFSTHEKKVKKAIEENKTAQKLDDLIEEVVVPTENVMEIKQGQQTIREKKLWPGYVLVRMTVTDASWNFIKQTNGVLDFLGGAGAEPLSDAEVESMLADLRDHGDEVRQKYEYEVGNPVKITEGVFVNFTGTVTDVFHDKGRLNVLVSIFGRETQVEDLEFWQVELITNEENNT